MTKSTESEAAQSPVPEYGLRLAAVRIQDFRVLQDVCVTLSAGTTVLVGENNSGKTSFLSALAIAFGQRQPALRDLFKKPKSSSKTFQIDLRIEPRITDEFDQSVLDVLGHGKQLADPDYFCIRTTGTVGAEGWDISLERTFLKGWAQNRVDAAELEELSSPPISRSVFKLLHFDMLDARRDIVEQLRSRRSYWGRTTSSVTIDPSDRATLEASLKQLGAEVTRKSPVLTQVRDDLKALSKGLSGEISVELETLPQDVEDLVRAMDIVLTSPDSSTFSIADQGMGTRSLAALLVFRSYVNIVRPNLGKQKILSVAAFEEPESHLHPQAQRAVFGLLNQIGGQRIVSTHSAFVAAIADIHSYRLFRREGPCATVKSVTDTTKWDMTKVQRFFQQERPELLFAKAVAIVEGQTEAAAFPIFAREYWAGGFDSVGVSLVHTGGAGNSKHIVPVLDALGIPWRIFCDGDSAGKKGLKSLSRVLCRTLERTSPEVVMLQSGDDIESCFFNHCPALVKETVGSTTLADFVSLRQGQRKNRSGETWDYNGDTTGEIACGDYLRDHKVEMGEKLARAICEQEKNFPPKIVEFFNQLDEARKAS